MDLFAQGSAQLHTKPGRDLDTLGALDVTRARPMLAGNMGRFAGVIRRVSKVFLTPAACLRVVAIHSAPTAIVGASAP